MKVYNVEKILNYLRDSKKPTLERGRKARHKSGTGQEKAHPTHMENLIFESILVIIKTKII